MAEAQQNIPRRASSKFPSCISLRPKISASRKVVGSGNCSVDICMVVVADAADRNILHLLEGFGMVYPTVDEDMDAATSPTSVRDVFMIVVLWYVLNSRM